MRWYSETGRKVFLFLLILCLSLLVAGCSGAKKAVSVSGTVQVYRSAISAPVEGVIVRLADQEVSTGTNGSFQFGQIPQGIYTLEVRNPRPAVKTISRGDRDLDGALLYTNKIQVGSSNLTVPITISPLGAVLRLGPSSWQLAFYASPPKGALITEAVITPPAPREPLQMEPHKFPPQWHVWWNIAAPEPGLYAYRIVLDNGEVEEFGFLFDESLFQDIQLPTQITPVNGETINTLTPTLTYEIPGSPSIVYIRIREIDSTQDTWNKVPGEAASFTIPSGHLENGKEYLWAIHTVDKAQPLPWTEALSASRIFTVNCE